MGGGNGWKSTLGRMEEESRWEKQYRGKVEKKEGGQNSAIYGFFSVCYTLVLCIRLLLETLFLASPR
jgi:hypothetical protein